MKMSQLYVAYAAGKARLTKGIKSFSSDQSGVTAIEYGLIAALLAVTIVTVLGTVSTNLVATFTTIASKL